MAEGAKISPPLVGSKFTKRLSLLYAGRMVVVGLTNFPEALHVIVAVVDVSVSVTVEGLGYVRTISDKSRVTSRPCCG